MLCLCAHFFLLYSKHHRALDIFPHGRQNASPRPRPLSVALSHWRNAPLYFPCLDALAKLFFLLFRCFLRWRVPLHSASLLLHLHHWCPQPLRPTNQGRQQCNRYLAGRFLGIRKKRSVLACASQSSHCFTVLKKRTISSHNSALKSTLVLAL